jgi:hypothetical protein
MTIDTNMTSDEEGRFKRLRNFNVVMGVVHLIQAILMLALSNDFSLPVTRSYLEFNAATQTLVPASETLFRIALGPLVSMFLFISAGAHFMISTVLHRRYVENLKKGMNPYRWAEYSLSASIMMIVIAMLVGIYDIGSLIMIFSLNATMIFFGYVMEVHNQTTDKTNWSSFIFGCFAGFIPWVVIAIYLLRGLLQHIRTEHGPAVQEEGEMEGLPLRREDVRHPEPCREIRARMAGLCGDSETSVSEFCHQSASKSAVFR